MALVFSCEFYQISKNISFTEHLWETASARRSSIKKGFLKIRKIHRRTPVLVFFFLEAYACSFIKNETPLGGCSCKKIKCNVTIESGRL